MHTITFGVGCNSFFFLIETKNKQKPNIVLLYEDDRRSEMGCYGKNQIIFPNIYVSSSKGQAYVLIKKGDGLTLQTKGFSFTQFIKIIQ